jgi:hypothetical protein
VLAFIALATLNSTVSLPAPVLALAADASGWLLLTAIAAVGLKTRPAEILKVGRPAAALLVAETLFLAGIVALALTVLPIRPDLTRQGDPRHADLHPDPRGHRPRTAGRAQDRDRPQDAGPGGKITLLTVLEQIPGFAAEFVTVKSENHLTARSWPISKPSPRDADDIDCKVTTGKPGVRIVEVAARSAPT